MFKTSTDKEAIFQRIDTKMQEMIAQFPEDFTSADIDKFNLELRSQLEAENLTLEDYHDSIANKLVDDTE